MICQNLFANIDYWRCTSLLSINDFAIKLCVYNVYENKHITHIFSEVGIHCVDQVRLKFVILLLLTPEFWDYWYMPPYLIPYDLNLF